jgi:hypothetical protein
MKTRAVELVMREIVVAAPMPVAPPMRKMRWGGGIVTIVFEPLGCYSSMSRMGSLAAE